MTYQTGIQLRAARTLARLHRRQLAALAGVHPHSVAAWETAAVVSPDADAVQKIAAALAARGVVATSAGVEFASPKAA